MYFFENQKPPVQLVKFDSKKKYSQIFLNKKHTPQLVQFDP